MEIPHKQVEELLREASEQKIMPLWQNLRRGDVAEKTPDEIVTIADRGCELFLIDHLPKLIEGSLVLGEESVHENPSLFVGITIRCPCLDHRPFGWNRQLCFRKTTYRYNGLPRLLRCHARGVDTESARWNVDECGKRVWGFLKEIHA